MKKLHSPKQLSKDYLRIYEQLFTCFDSFEQQDISVGFQVGDHI